MSTQRYSVTPHAIDILLSWVKSGEIAIPEIQRPFVWEASKVRDLLDSLYQGFPVGYLIAWRNPTVKLKDGTSSAGKRILIDGQQRVTALMAALLGQEVLTKDYETVRIRIAFNPQDERFEVANPAIRKDPAWLEDIAALFDPEMSITELTDDYAARNPAADRRQISKVLERLRRITNNHVGVIELADDLDIETVTEIFIRVNSKGTELSQADFAMSKIAANDTYNGHVLRKAIDYFCHMAIAPEFSRRIEKSDTKFAASDFYDKMRWLKDANDDIYDPSYTDMLRVAFTSEFHRGKLQDLVALLSGRNFETKQYEEEIAEASFAKLKTGIMAFMNQTHFERMSMILRSAGFVSNSMIGGQNAVNFAYVIYLRGRAEKLPPAQLERLVRRWYVMSVLKRRYSASPESAFDSDIRQIAAHGLTEHVETILASELNTSYWEATLPQLMDTSSTVSPYFHAWLAALVKQGDHGFLSKDILVRDLILHRSDLHHIFPRNFLKKQGLARGQYNQIANFTVMQTEINIAVGDRAPGNYFAELHRQVQDGPLRYGGITDRDSLRANLAAHCVPESLLETPEPDYEDFLLQRRKLMALKLQSWYESL